MATDTALCDNLAQKNVILPQIHTCYGSLKGSWFVVIHHPVLHLVVPSRSNWGA